VLAGDAEADAAEKASKDRLKREAKVAARYKLQRLDLDFTVLQSPLANAVTHLSGLQLLPMKRPLTLVIFSEDLRDVKRSLKITNGLR
jgi:hypothetical protein